MPDADGISAREHYRQVERASGRRPPELDGPDLPQPVAYLWEWFRELRAGDTKLTHQEIEAWSRLYGLSLERWEVRALRLLYQLLMGIVAEHTQNALKLPEKSDD